jgi:hypothetical protein
MAEGFVGKIIYRPPERAFSNAWIVETEHGYKVFKERGDARPISFIPHSAVKNVEYRGDRNVR